MSQAYARLGRWSYLVLLPIMRLVLKRTDRVYVLFIHEEQVLVIKNWLSRQKWRLPGGGIGSNEDVLDAVLRECHEELGLKLKKIELTPITSGKWQHDNLQFGYQIFMCHVSSKPKLTIKRSEIVAAEWAEPSQLNSQNASPEMVAALTSAGLKTT